MLTGAVAACVSVPYRIADIPKAYILAEGRHREALFGIDEPVSNLKPKTSLVNHSTALVLIEELT
jgi:hypothetical protein